ncbi:MAG: amidase [Candidatus Saganbacteria bacterium]|uniref:Amidase n=1 Tax=Candidatus Saganbacteria bacterium TaxID=2575572 RepID=A0A833NXD1_UNCSA|nr:MAG: amidase [Candidatus Saganbacteria bacterium]
MDRFIDNHTERHNMKKIIIFALLMIAVLIIPAFAVDNLIVSDPMRIGVGARPLGMGKAYVAMAEDGDGIFSNPAGLGKIDGPKLTSMYSNVLGDVSYIVLGGAYPATKNSAIGLGAVVSGVSSISLYDSNAQPAGSANWGSSVVFLSYGLNLEDAKLQLGGSVKYYNQGGSGTKDIESASASGLGVDVGAIYSPSDMLSLGLNAQNPFSTKLESGNKVENSLITNIKGGVKVTLRPTESQKINILADADMAKRRPAALHFGAEYLPVPNIAIRAGLDDKDITAGVGLRAGGMEFNYAYHPYGSVAEDSTHYFSVSYVGPDKKDDSADLELSVVKPADKSVIYADNIEVTGTIKTKKGAAYPVKINGINAAVDPSGNFTFNLTVDKVGKKLIVVEATDISGKVIAKDSRKVLRLVQFSDVGDKYWAKKPIEHTGTVGLIQGYPDGTFRPDRSLTRAEMATLLVRAKNARIPGYARKVFKDVSTKYWAANYIEAAERMGLIKGYPGGKFCPNSRVNKAEAITILARFDSLLLSAEEDKPYRDVAVKHWAAKYISAAKDSGMLSYIEGGKLRPKEDVSRAEAVEMLSKTNMAGKQINELLSWDRGYELELARPVIRAGLD